MPEMTGWDFLGEFKSLTYKRKTHIIISLANK